MTRLYTAELERTGSPRRARSRTSVLVGVLQAVATSDRRGVDGQRNGFAPASFTRNRTSLGKAGICPFKAPADLATVAADLGVSDTISLARLVWSLQPVLERSRDRLIESWAPFIADARGLLVPDAAILRTDTPRPVDTDPVTPIVEWRGETMGESCSASSEHPAGPDLPGARAFPGGDLR